MSKQMIDSFVQQARQQETALSIVEAIVEDILTRSGFGDQWESIDSSIQREIRKDWLAIVKKELTAAQEDD